MKKNLNKIFMVIFIILPFILLLPVRADSGWDSDYDSGGSWDSGSSWDSGGSWDSGSSWDSGYSSSSNYHSSGSSDIGIFIWVAIIIIIIIISSVSKELSNKKVDTTRYDVDLSYDNEDAYHVESTNHKDISDAQIKKLLPKYSLNSLKEMAFKKFIEIQNAWSEFDYDKLRELLTDELYNSYVSQLETLKLKNGKNVMNDFSNQTIKITDIKEEAGNIILTVYLKVSFYDYVINKTTGEVTRGKSDRKLTNNYMMTFIKSHDEIKITNCPTCGAPIKGNASKVCEYCDSTIISDSNEFVMSKKTNINKRK